MDVLNESFSKSFLQNVQENTFKSLLKLTSAPKLLFHKVDPVADLMIFFIWRKYNISFSRYLDFCVFVKSTYFKNLMEHNGSDTYVYFF